MGQRQIWRAADNRAADNDAIGSGRPRLAQTCLRCSDRSQLAVAQVQSVGEQRVSDIRSYERDGAVIWLADLPEHPKVDYQPGPTRWGRRS